MAHRLSHFTAAALLAGAALAATPARAGVITSVPVGAATSVITFSAYDGVTAPVAVPGAVDVGTAAGLEAVMLSFSGGASDFRILGAVPTALGVNNSWPIDGAFAGLNANAGSMTFSFDRALGLVGGFISFDPASYDGTLSLEALDAGGNVLEDYSAFPSSTVLGDGAFYGFARSEGDIWGLRLNNANVVLDNLTFSAGAGVISVSEPASLSLVLLGGLALALGRRRLASR